MTNKSTFSEDYKHIISLLIEARKKNRLTQNQVAEMLGKPQSYVSKYELSERRLDILEFMEICRVLGLRPSKVMVLVQ